MGSPARSSPTWSPDLRGARTRGLARCAHHRPGWGREPDHRRARPYIRTDLKNLHSPVRVPQGAWKRDGYVKPVGINLSALDKTDLYAPTPEDELIDKETLDLLGENRQAFELVDRHV